MQQPPYQSPYNQPPFVERGDLRTQGSPFLAQPSTTPAPGTYPQQPYMQPGQPYQPPKKPGAPWGWIAAILIVAILCYLGGYGAGVSSAQSALQPAQTVMQGRATTTPGRKASTQPPHKAVWTTVATFTGTGGKNTAAFSVGDQWKIVWECSYSEAANLGPAPFYIDVYQGSDMQLGAGASSSCKVGKTTGESEEHQGGKFYLNVNTGSSIPWKLTIQELK